MLLTGKSIFKGLHMSRISREKYPFSKFDWFVYVIFECMRYVNIRDGILRKQKLVAVARLHIAARRNNFSISVLIG